MTPVKQGAVYADLLEVPSHKVAEIVDGDLYVSSRPAPRQALAKSVLGSELGALFHQGAPGGWWILDEPELHLSHDVLVPDLAAWRRERLPEFPDIPAFTLAPDWTCEVLSPSTETLDRAKKMPAYAREGVAFLWLLDPVTRTLESYRLSGGHWLLLATRAGSARFRAEPFDAAELDLAALWGEA
jgi:Uma2 family endonuclease